MNSKTREIDRSYLCLQQFDKFWMWSGNDHRKRKLLKLAEIRLGKFREITSDIFFVADFAHLDLLCISRFTYNEVKSYNKHVCGYRLQKEAPVTFYRPK